MGHFLRFMAGSSYIGHKSNLLTSPLLESPKLQNVAADKGKKCSRVWCIFNVLQRSDTEKSVTILQGQMMKQVEWEPCQLWYVWFLITSMSPVEFQRFVVVRSIPKFTEAVFCGSWWPNTLLSHLIYCVSYLALTLTKFTCTPTIQFCSMIT